MRNYSRRLFIASSIGIPVTAGVLFLGMVMTGGGHGSYGVWYFGLALSFLCWVVAMISTVTGIVAWSRETRPVWWVVPEALIFVGLTVLGLWGLGG